MKQYNQTTKPTSNKALEFAKFLKLPLALSVSSCLLMACQSTPKATQPISQAPASTQAQQAIYDPYGTQINAPKQEQQPTIQLPNVGTLSTTPQTQQPTQPITQTPQSIQTPLYTGTIDQATLMGLNGLLNARTMSLVQNDKALLQTHNSLWQRIIHGTRIPVPNNNPRIETERVWFLSNTNYIDNMAIRASRYLHHTVSEAERRGIPVELALIPALESSYDPSAISNTNASGLWQLLPSTGRIYGLNQSPSYDGRRDVIESTRAAYDFLTSLYNQFGSWELALAAYSAGPGVVQTAIESNRSNNLPTDFWSLILPKETMHYVPRFLALSNILATPSRYNLTTLPNLANRHYFRTVPVNYGVTLYEISQVTGVSLDELQLLNPALLNSRVDSPAPNRVLVPDQLDASFDAKISALGGQGIAIAPFQQSEFILPIRSFGVNYDSEAQLRKTAALPTTNAKLTVNNTIVPTPSLSLEEKQLIIAQLNSAKPKVQPISTVDGNIQLLAITTSQAVLNSSGQPKTLQYGVSVSPTSHLINTPAYTNTQTTSPTPTVPEPTKTEPITKPETATKPTTNTGLLTENYIIKDGDQLARIAKNHGMTTDELATLNGIDKNVPIRSGQILKVKAGSQKTESTKTEIKKTEPVKVSTKVDSKKTEPKKANITKTDSNKPATESYTVQNGDSLTKLAKSYNISTEELAKLNNLTPNDTLKRGQKLVVPKTVKTNTSQPAKTTTTTAQKTPVKKGTYVVKSGDSLIGIANRFGTTQTDIAALNDFAVGAKLEKGQVINMPVAIPASESRSEPKTEPKNDTKTTNVGKAIKNTEDYTVQPKDSLIGLSKRYNVTVEDLAATNNLATNALLKSGQVIKVPKLYTTYVVKNGDSLTKLAKSYNISTEELAKLNNLTPNDTLKRGQKLVVPNH